MDENLKRAIAQLEQASTGSAAIYRGAIGLVVAAARQAETLQSALESATETNQVLGERLRAAASVLEGYEVWEAHVIEEDAAWNTPAAHPWQTDELYDEWMELQHARNQAMRPMRQETEVARG